MSAILPLILQYGVPQVISLVELWSKHEPDNVQPQEILALLKTIKPYSAYVPPA